MSDVDTWIEANADRVAARQRAQVETAKLLTTFATGVAAALVAAALQVDGATGWDLAAAILLAVAATLTVMTIAADRLKEPDHEHIVTTSRAGGMSELGILRTLRVELLTAVRLNEFVVRVVMVLTGLQIATAAAAGTVAALALQLR